MPKEPQDFGRQGMGEATFACDRTALTPQQRAEHTVALRSLFGSVQRIEELSSGYAFTFPATAHLIADAAKFLSLERLCCPFFSFAVEIPAGVPSIRLSITGPTGIKPVIQGEFSAVLPSSSGFERAVDGGHLKR
jgi:hypothetical protein